MINAWISPFSEVYLGNKLFSYDKVLNRDGDLSVMGYLKKYCLIRNINLNTIDLWNAKEATDEDVYVSFNHKERRFIGKVYSLFKNRGYYNPKKDNFLKKNLFQFEPPVVHPHVYKQLEKLTSIYDEIFLSCKLDSKYGHFNWPQNHNNVIPDYWANANRYFLTMINANKKPRSRHKELYSERIKAVEFFSETNDVDLYGFGWDKHPYFPYWFYKSALKKVYKGSVESKYQTLSKYNFSICFENCIMPGYITEKIFDSFFAGTIPVYWGASDIVDYVPKDCFIDMCDFKNYAELRQFLKSITKSEIESYRENARRYLSSEQYKPFTKEYFAEMFADVIKRDVKCAEYKNKGES